MKLEFKQSLKNFDIEVLKRAYKKVFTGEEGGMILENLAEVSGMYNSNYSRGEMDFTSFKEGQRALFLYICSYLREEKVKNIDGEKAI